MSEHKGYLFAKLDRIDSKSEGPEYYLQEWDKDGNTKEYFVDKKVNLWEIDPVLHQFLGMKVIIEGQMNNRKITFEKISKWIESSGSNKHKLELKLKLGLDDGVLWLNKREFGEYPKPEVRKELPITLFVEWPYRSIWQGKCETSQLYDFFMEDPEGNTIWQWSKCILFKDEPTAVNIWGGLPHPFPVIWNYFDDAIPSEGLYTIRTVFLATGQEANITFEARIIPFLSNREALGLPSEVNNT